MNSGEKADKLELLNFRSLHTRTFHMSWFAFFMCFFAWFGIAPLMPVIREELSLSDEQIGNIIIASVTVTVFARVLVGWICDRVGPRITYAVLLLLGSIPVIGIGFSYDYQSFLIFRLAIGAIGASFVISQYHTSVFYSPACVGTANATSAGWGNMGGGATQMAMPLFFSLLVGAGIAEFWSWRICMVVVGVLCALIGVAYYFFTQDTPEGNFRELRAAGKLSHKADASGGFLDTCRDPRVWVLFFIYAACFGVEITMHNVAALYFSDYFNLGLVEAGIIAGSFGLMNVFARSLGGYFGDKAGTRFGLKGRVTWLGAVLFIEGLALMLFSRMEVLPLAIVALMIFGLFVKMSSGATFSVVPFVNPRSVGSVSGLVGAGGNAGAVAAGFLFKGGVAWPDAFLILGAAVVVIASLTFLLRFPQPSSDSSNSVSALPTTAMES